MESKPAPSFRPSFDSLEARDLMAANLTASITGDLLRIEGTAEDDTIVVRQTENQITIDNAIIKVDGSLEKSVDGGAVERIEIRGLSGNDRIWLNTEALGGDPLDIPVTVWAGTGDDQVWGSSGNDQLFGESGDDQLHGLSGDDILNGGSGSDQLIGGIGSDLLNGGTGADFLSGDSGDDLLQGGSGDDEVRGGTGSDILQGGAGANLLLGNDGNDTIRSASGSDRVDGGHGHDIAQLTYQQSSTSSVFGTEKIQSTTTEAPPEVKPEPAPVARPVATPKAPVPVARPVATPKTPAPVAKVVQEEVEVTGRFAKEVKEVYRRLNSYRGRKGEDALNLNAELMEAAQYQADYMAKTEHYDHVNLDGRTLSDRVSEAGYAYWWVAENAHKYDPENRRTQGITRTYSESELARYFMDGWKKSPGHNGSMLSSRAKEVGIAIARSANGNIYAVQVFGDPR